MQNQHPLSLVLLTALAPVIWGSTYLVTSQWLPADNPLSAGVIRAIPAGLLLLLFSRQWLQGVWWWRALILGALNIGLFFFCLFSAAYRLPGGVAAILLSSQPIWVLLLGALLLKVEITVQTLLLSVLGFIGVALLIGASAVHLDAWGVFLALLGAFAMALGLVLVKKWHRPESLSMVGLTGWQLLFGGLLLLPVALMVEGLPHGLSITNLLAYAYLMLFGAMLSYCFWFNGLQRLPALTTSLLGLLSPVSAGLLGYWLLNEHFTATQLLGIGCIAMTLAGSLLPLLQSARAKTAKLP